MAIITRKMAQKLIFNRITELENRIKFQDIGPKEDRCLKDLLEINIKWFEAFGGTYSCKNINNVESADLENPYMSIQ